MVGQHFIKFLQDHPWFELTWLGASDRSAGKPYREATNWRLDGAMPASVQRTQGGRVQARQRAAAGVLRDGRLGGHGNRTGVCAGRPRGRLQLAQSSHGAGCSAAGARSQSRSSEVIPHQQRKRGWKGQIVTNPNCSTIVLTMALAPLKQFGITRVDRHHPAGHLGRGLSGRAFHGHHRQRDSVHRRRRRKDAAGDAEDPGRFRGR